MVFYCYERMKYRGVICELEFCDCRFWFVGVWVEMVFLVDIVRIVFLLFVISLWYLVEVVWIDRGIYIVYVLSIYVYDYIIEEFIDNI